MITATDAFKARMTSSVATIYGRVDLLDKNENLLDRYDAQILDASITVDKSRDGRREFSLTLDNRSGRFTWNVGGYVWIDKRVQLYIGLMTPSGIEYVSAGVFFLERAEATSRADGTRTATLSGSDKWALYNGEPLGKFTYSTKIAKDVNIAAAIRQLATDAGESAAKLAFDACPTLVPYDLTYQLGESRGKAMKELAELALFDLYYDVNGFLRFRAKVTDLSTAPIVWTYDKNAPNTLYAGGVRTFDATETFNKVVVIGKDVSAIAVNSDPNSPISTVNVGERVFTYNGGAVDPLISTVPLAQARADYELAEHSRIVETTSFEIVPNFLHEAGDVVTVIDDWNGSNDRYEIVRFDINLRGDSLMRVEAQKIRKVA